ncbi:hypothetical protein MMC09_000047 [Bachmanniomyces sp. S44760]|nr:hypothetical protein [Bachmanniomyces sp. S44760]
MDRYNLRHRRGAAIPEETVEQTVGETVEETIEAGPSYQEVQDEEASQDVLRPVYVAIFEGSFEGAFKHWAVFVENKQNPPRGFICHALGSSGRFWYEQIFKDAHASSKLVESIQFGYVRSSNLRPLRSVAKRIQIENNVPTWNCQDFAWNLLKELGATGLVDPDDQLYQIGRATVRSRMEGFV